MNEQNLAQKTISYNDIQLLKNRSNKEQKDVINYDTFDPIRIDEEAVKRLELVNYILINLSTLLGIACLQMHIALKLQM